MSKMVDRRNLMEQLVGSVFEAASRSATRQQMLAEVLGEVQTWMGADFVAVVCFERGAWRMTESCGVDRALPYELLSESLDAQTTIAAGSWIAGAIVDQQRPGSVLVVGGVDTGSDRLVPAVDRLTTWLAAALRVVDVGHRQRQQIKRLEAILSIAAQWGQTFEMDQLFHQMAEASTKLLDAERASIFLWDRANKTLVGRPALGVEGGELKVADDAGVVGQVVQSGEPHRVDIEQGQEGIDRHVDQQLGYETRTLLCVPLRGRGGELFGAFELINKRSGCFTDDDQEALCELATHAAGALENTQQYEQLLRSQNQIADQAAAGVELVGECPAIEALRSTIRRVADTELAVLLLGENGTGKEVVSRMVHYLSRRRLEPFVAVNCAALTETLLESELFGHEKGAFTDASETRAGKFELAADGTLFLDEIGDMSLSGQAKLLRVLEDKVVVRVGGSTPIHTGARVVAATNQNLTELVRQKKFREDLYYRLNVVTLELPPLRDRSDDVVLLAERFLRDFCAKAGRKTLRLTSAARRRLAGHTWPGNVRELRNLMERIAYLSVGDTVDVDELAFILAPQDDQTGWLPDGLPLADATRQFQSEYIRKQIDRAHGNMTDAAQNLGLHRANLYRKLRQLGAEA